MNAGNTLLMGSQDSIVRMQNRHRASLILHRSTSFLMWRSIRLGCLALLITLYAIGINPRPVQAQGIGVLAPTVSGPENTLGSQSDSDIWRAIRQGAPGLPSSSEVTNGVLINAEGVWWSELRRPDGKLVQYGGIGIAAVVGAVALFFLIRGQLRIDGGRSGKMVARFSLLQRVAHWVIASLFLLLGVTGLLLLFGRAILIPVIGTTAFSIVATASMQAHNLFGPLFILSLFTLFAAFVRGNLPTLSDLGWVIRGGGLIGGHVSAGRYNAGEKAWFWTATGAGLVLSVSGMILSFPDDLGSYGVLHKAELSHAIAAFVFIGFGIGHIYLGTIGTEGTIDGMVKGAVDENWARTHHDLWLAEIEAKKDEAKT